jgi:hypothetical protein
MGRSALVCVVRLSAIACGLGICFGQAVPFSFTLGGLPSQDLLPRWQFVSSSSALPEGRVQNESSWWDPATGFWIQSVSIAYAADDDHATLATSEWLLTFGANGTSATPALCNVAPLNVTALDYSGTNGTTDVFRYLGSFASADDYSAVNVTLQTPKAGPFIPPILNSTRVWGAVFHHDTTTSSPEACRDQCIAAQAGGTPCGGMAFSELSDPSLNGCWLVTSVTQLTQQVGFSSWVSADSSSTTSWAPAGGRSSNGELPFFTIVSAGVGRTISVGWSGNWEAAVSRGGDGSSVISVMHPTLCASLNPGDAFRSMRILQVSRNAAFDSVNCLCGWPMSTLQALIPMLNAPLVRRSFSMRRPLHPTTRASTRIDASWRPLSCPAPQPQATHWGRLWHPGPG